MLLIILHNNWNIIEIIGITDSRSRLNFLFHSLPRIDSTLCKDTTYTFSILKVRKLSIYLQPVHNIISLVLSLLIIFVN